ncbi:hypothetical protein, partial [Mycolicibacterium iranicum]|uniref:hypothetical protein n=1 Tax=Mycolicibacterium iranicum TaxID=912594 RepID=UPI000AC2532E
KVARTLTAASSALASDAPFPYLAPALFNSTIRRSKDIGWDGARFTVRDTGPYLLSIGLKTSTTPGGVQETFIGAFINGAIDSWKFTGLWTNGVQDHFAAEIPVYLVAGQNVTGGVRFGNDPAIVGTADGTATYMTLTKLG